MTEPDVTLTDYALAVECLVFTVLMLRVPTIQHRLRFWFSLFFASVSAATILGGTVHGFFVDETTRGYAILWPATMLAFGVTSLAAWVIGAHLMQFKHFAGWVLLFSSVQFALYVLVVLFHNEQFWVAILNNLLAVSFLLVVLVRAHRRERCSGYLLAAGGLALNVFAGVLQQLGIGIHPIYFNHNAVYHAVQAVALLLFFVGVRRLVATELRTSKTAAAVLEQSV